jgi:IPT/TIG domain
MTKMRRMDVRRGAALTLLGALVTAAALTGVAGGSPGAVTPAQRGAILPPIGASIQDFSPLIYHGGPVMRTNKTYAIYWVPAGYSVSPNYKTLIDRYFADVAAASGQTTNVYSVETQYYDGTGPIAYSSTFGGSVIDTNPFPASGCPLYGGLPKCLTDAQIVAEINAVVAANGWTTNGQTEFFMFTPEHVASCFSGAGGSCAYTNYCAYHSYSGSLIYANQPYTVESSFPTACDTGERPNGDAADPTINVASHEHREAINDWQLNAWYDQNGWEGSDKCAWNFGAPIFGPPGAHYNQVINGHNYYLQQEFSNAGLTCLLAYGGGPPPGSPTISSFSPTSGPVGTIVTVNGTNFTGTTAVKFNNTNASFQVLGPTQLRAAVPVGATTGKISVTNPSGTGQSATDFTVTGGAGAPTVSSFSPTSGPVGTIVTVYGSGFSGVISVKFNGTSAPFQVSSPTRLYTQVPGGATTGPISVTTSAGTGSSATNFTVIGGGGGTPVVSSFSPTSGPAGTIVTVYGSGFTGTTAVKFNGTSAQFLVASSTKLYARVPTGATTGKISVTTPGGTGTSATNFTVT